MWFKPARRNRRRNPGQVLDVKVRTNQLRDNRARFAVKVFLAGLGTVAGLYVLVCMVEWGLDKFVYENPAFAIAQVDIQTDGSLTPEQLRRWSGVAPGANLIALDLASVKRNLELVSTINTVSIERILPRTLKIRVTERHPVAELGVLRSLPSGDVDVVTFQLDINGFVMQPPDRHAPSALVSRLNYLPDITGLDYTDLQLGQPLKSPQALAALRLISAFNRSPMSRLVDLRSVDISAPGVLVAATGSGSEVTFAPDRPEQQLERWYLVYDWGRRDGRAVASLDLAVGNNVPVKWNLAGAAPVLNPHPAKPLNSRRKNV